MANEPYYLLAIVPAEGKAFVTWADGYLFDSEKESVTVYSRYGHKGATYDLVNKIKRIDIYDVSKPHGDQAPIQTILWRKNA